MVFVCIRMCLFAPYEQTCAPAVDGSNGTLNLKNIEGLEARVEAAVAAVHEARKLMDLAVMRDPFVSPVVQWGERHAFMGRGRPPVSD